MSSIKNLHSPMNICNRLYLSYLCLFCITYLLFFTNTPSWYETILPIMMWMIGFLFNNIFLKDSNKSLFVPVFFFQIISIFIMVCVNNYAYHEPLGPNAIDSLRYRWLGEVHGGKSYLEFLYWIITVYGVNYDDIGYPTIIWLSYNLFGKYGSEALLFLNAVIVAWGSVLFYKLSSNFVSPRYARMIALLWGCMPFAVYQASTGLKENFFLFFVVCSFFYLYNYYKRKLIVDFFLAVLFCLFLFLFRLACGYMALLSLLSVFFVRAHFVKRNLKLLISIVFVIGLLLFPIIVGRIGEQRGITYDHLVHKSDMKTESGGTAMYIANGISGTIGPIPSFASNDELKRNYMPRYSFTLYVKLIVSFFFWYSLCYFIRIRDLKALPLIIFSLLDILMVIFSYFALQIRMQWPHIPFFFLLATIGYLNYKKNRLNNTIFHIYLLFSFVLVLLYNIR